MVAREARTTVKMTVARETRTSVKMTVAREARITVKMTDGSKRGKKNREDDKANILITRQRRVARRPL